MQIGCNMLSAPHQSQNRSGLLAQTLALHSAPRHQCRIGFTVQCNVWCSASTGERSDVKPTRDPIHLHRAPGPKTAKTKVKIMLGQYEAKKKEERTITIKQPPWEKK